MTEELSPPPGSFPALSSLDLSREHLAALSQQGSIVAEGPQKRYHKLRFVFRGERLSRYVGCKAGFLEQVRRELATLQNGLAVRRSLRRLGRQARLCHRETKACLQPVLAETGHYYHGREIRKRRTNQDNRNSSCPSQKFSLRSVIMDDRHKKHEDALINRRTHNSERAPTSAADRHRERITDLAMSASDLEDHRQAVFRYATAKFLGMSTSVAQQVEDELREQKMTIRELRKYALPVLTCMGTLAKQALRCAQLDRDYGSAPDRKHEPQLSLPRSDSGES